MTRIKSTIDNKPVCFHGGGSENPKACASEKR
jgi:hypothetical protein